jgi:phage terminase large subunit
MKQLKPEARETLLWWAALRRESNAAFLPLFLDEHRYLVLMGGGGSGKSIFAGRKVLERCIRESGHRWLVCRKVAKTLRDSCFAQLRGQLGDHYPGVKAKVNKSDMRIELPNGSLILFAGLDDAEKLKSIYNITGIWIEETSEREEGDFNQLDIRLRGETAWYKQIILSFNPISVTHWLKRRFFDRPDERARIHRSTYRDNRFLDPEAIATLEGFRDRDPYYYQVYCLGQWGVTGRTVFNARAVSRRLAEAPEPVREGFFTYREVPGTAEDPRPRIESWTWQEEKGGPIQIFREPAKGRPYVLGGDTAGEGSDWFTAQVLDNITGEQAAVLRHRYDEDTYAKQVYCLGRTYNTALVGIETNFSTYPVKRLEELGYPRQYVREAEDTFSGPEPRSFGFRTTAVTRPVILSGLVEAMREALEGVSHRTTLEEMLTFVRDEHMRPAAEPGAHDDCVLALAIAWYIRPRQRMTPETAAEEGRRRWTADMWEDYRGADGEERKRMLAAWGTPK